MKKFLNSYLKEIQTKLLCSSKKKKQIINALSENIQNDLQSYPDCDFDFIIKKYGTPDEIADAYLESINREAFYKCTAQKNKKIVRLIIIISACAIVALSIYHTAYKHFHRVVPYSEYVIQQQ